MPTISGFLFLLFELYRIIILLVYNINVQKDFLYGNYIKINNTI